VPAEAAGTRLVPYLPRVTLDWLRDDPAAKRRALAGTMAFVDVSGFTAMSERLAPKGRLGAEEVTDVMSATFGRLLGFAYEHGGGLVKLGGDAMLLFFDGEDHARHACAAAWSMRDSLAALGPLQTSAGDVELRMHVGVHSGTFDFFLVGTRHRELIVAGAAAWETVEMEDTADVRPWPRSQSPIAGNSRQLSAPAWTSPVWTYLKRKSARRRVPSFSFRIRVRQELAQPASVFQEYW
jgi:class 3 adenylate cyclase